VVLVGFVCEVRCAGRGAECVHVDAGGVAGGGAEGFVALPHELGVVCSVVRECERAECGHYLRSPHALQSVRAPSGPRRHSGVSRILHE
jgi:hypothetical protein